MKKLLTFSIVLFISLQGLCQKTKPLPDKQTVLSEFAQRSCKCIDSIAIEERPKEEMVKKINACIKEQVTAYQLTTQLLSVDLTQGGNKKVDIIVNTNESSADYKRSYYELEKYLMDSCEALKNKLATNEKTSKNSFSKNEGARSFYNRGLEEAKNNQIDKAIISYQRALEIDSTFAFAWDNLGICYRKAGKFDEALNAYKKSLEIDSMGAMPLQNIAVVYQYKKQYAEAIDAYKRLAKIHPDDPEVYYGIGNVYVITQEYEKGLDYMCQAYTMYIKQKSPYRTDAEKLIQTIYAEMKKNGQEDKFYEILKQNNITPDKK